MRKILKTLGILILAFAILTAFSFSGIIIYAKSKIDLNFDEELFNRAKEDQTVYYYAYNLNDELVEVFKGTRNTIKEWTDISLVGDNLKNAFIAMEDRDFYEHKGVNIKRTVAAAANHILRIRDSFGASTITQQLIKNLSGDNQTNIMRKVKEIIRAIKLEQKHSKDDIFELYLNVVPMSGNIYGVGAAAEIYFGKDPLDLTLSEAATIVGITNAPAVYNPYTKREACIEKRNRVLYAMREMKYISDQEYDEAIAEPLILNGRTNFGVASWFVETAKDEIVSDISGQYGISRAAASILLSGARVILTERPEIQDILDSYFSNEGNLSTKVEDGLNYSMVVSDPYTGDLLALVGNGGKKSGDKLFNYATSNIIPGSVIKPLSVYAPLIQEGTINWASIMEDTPVETRFVNGDEVNYPRNSPDVYEGHIDLCDAIRKSKNTVAVRLFNQLGARRIFDHLKNVYGFDTIVENGVGSNGETVSDMSAAPLALGQLSYGVSLRKLTEAYNVFASGGVLHRGRSYISVYNSSGEEIISRSISKQSVYSKDTANLMNQLLSRVVIDGTASQIKLKELVDVAGKTGTSGGDRDRLFIGYTPYFTAGIWCGYGGHNKAVGNNSPSHLNIWDEVMHLIHEKTVMAGFRDEIKGFDTSDLIISPYCSKSGLAPNELCELDDDASVKLGYFKKKDCPVEECEHNTMFTN